MEKNNEVVKVENQVSTQGEMNIDNVIAQVALQDNGLERLEKLMDLRDRDEAFKAKKSFDKAMSDFQAECPVINKTTEGSKTREGSLVFKYATLGNIVKQVKDILKKHGLSYDFKTEELEGGKIKAICTAKHFEGGSNSSDFIVPLVPKTGVMTEAQVKSATATYARRNAFCDVFGILTADEDNLDQMNYAEVEQKDQKWIDSINNLKSMNEYSQFYNKCSQQKQELYHDEFLAKKESFRTPKSSEVDDKDIPTIQI